jgi:hypothetical protein
LTLPLGHSSARFGRGALKSEVLAIAISPGNQKFLAVSDNETTLAFRLSDRNADDEQTPRVVSQLKLGIFTAVDVVFKSEKKAIVVLSLGMCTYLLFEGGLMVPIENSSLSEWIRRCIACVYPWIMGAERRL